MAEPLLGGSGGRSPPKWTSDCDERQGQLVDYTVAGVEGGLCAPRGFRAAGGDAGLTSGARPDLGLVGSQQTSVAAGRFTSHPFASAPVRWSRAQLRAGMARAVLG